MNAIVEGHRVTYYPAPKNDDDNRHWPAIVEKVDGKRARVRVFRDDAPPPDGKVVHCSVKRLVPGQVELLGEPVE